MVLGYVFLFFFIYLGEMVVGWLMDEKLRAVFSWGFGRVG